MSHDGHPMITKAHLEPMAQVLFGLRFYVPVNSYGHVETVSSPNHTFFLGKLIKAVDQYSVHILIKTQHCI